MSRVCEICGKGPVVGHNVSHSNIKSKKRWLPNIQKIKINDNGTIRHARVCTKCIKDGKVVKAV